MNKTAFVDIDNTLWQFCDVFYTELKRINRDFPSIESWTHWDIWQGYCSEHEFFGAVNSIHLRQDSDEFQPYPDARNFLSALRQNGYHITIASHRSPEYLGQTERWLQRHGLVYDDIHLSYHKTEIINSGTSLVVDDSPEVLEKAVEKGAMATGLLFPWNKAYCNNGFSLFSSLTDILSHIMDETRKNGS